MSFPLNELRRLARQGKVAVLEPREREVVALRLGGSTQQEVADALGVSQPTVSILEREAKKKLKASMREATDAMVF